MTCGSLKLKKSSTYSRRAAPEVNICCEKCSGQIIKSYPRGEVKMRAKLCVWNENGFFAVCKSCGTEVPIGMDILRSIDMKFTYEVDNNIAKSGKDTVE